MNETTSDHSAASTGWFGTPEVHSHHVTPSSVTNGEDQDTQNSIRNVDDRFGVSPHTSARHHDTDSNTHDDAGESNFQDFMSQTNGAANSHGQQTALHLTHEDLKQLTDFTNLGDADFSALEEHLSMFASNGTPQHAGDTDRDQDQDQDHRHQQHQHQQHQQQQNQQQHQQQHHHSIGSDTGVEEMEEMEEMDTHYTEFSHTAFPPVDAQQQAAHAHRQSVDFGQDQAVRPDLIFTPLVSPAVTPMDKNLQQQQQQQQQQHMRQLDSSGTNGNGMFSPLTSPALEFQQVRSSPIMRIKKENFEDASSASNHKRRASNNAGNSSQMIPGRVQKQSPVIKTRRPSSLVNKHYGEIKLPESSMDFKTPPKRNGAKPAAKPAQTAEHHPFTPATLMNFKVDNGRSKEAQKSSNSVDTASTTASPPSGQPAQLAQHQLAQHQHQHQHQQQQQVVLNKNREHSSSSSPVILPSSTTPVMGPRRSSSVSSRHKSVTSKKDSSTTSLNTLVSNGNSNSNDDGGVGPSGHPFDKKTNHKLAEQGRRNRMNQAIQSLDELIPSDWKKDILVPSKATTIEVAIEYLKFLQERGASVHTHNDTSDSISPFD